MHLSPQRAVVAACCLFALSGGALAAMALRSAAAPAPLTFVLLVPPIAAAVGMNWVLGRLRRDLAALADFVRDPEAAPPSRRSRETRALFDAATLLRTRSLEIEALEREASALVEDAENVRVSFVASMGHDLRAPLNAIVGFADLIVMADQAAIEASQRQSVEIIRRSARDLLVLLDQILDWARLEAGRMALQRQNVSPAELVVQAVREAEARSADRGLAIELELQGELPRVTVDSERFVEALLGLFDHATRTANAPRVLVCASADTNAAGNALHVEIHDPGLRIRTADQQTFFEPFRPSFAPSGQRIAGLGLGPALARALIRAHGGDVWFASDPRKGTTFHVRLPLAAEERPGDGPAPE